MSIDFLAGKNTFALIEGSNQESQFFGGIRLFGGKKSTSSKYWDINVYRLFEGKKYVSFGGKKSTS